MTMRTIKGVEIDLDDIEDKDIQDEFEARGLECDCDCDCDEDEFAEYPSGGDFTGEIREMYQAFKLGKNDKAMEIAKSMAQELTGGIL